MLLTLWVITAFGSIKIQFTVTNLLLRYIFSPHGTDLARNCFTSSDIAANKWKILIMKSLFYCGTSSNNDNKTAKIIWLKNEIIYSAYYLNSSVVITLLWESNTELIIEVIFHFLMENPFGSNLLGKKLSVQKDRWWFAGLGTLLNKFYLLRMRRVYVL